MEESTKFYLDSNVFINAAADDTLLGAKSREIINAVQNNKISAVTSCITIDETAWILRKTQEKALVLNNCKMFLDSNIKFLDVNKGIINVSLEINKEFNLKPRDAIHAATMKVNDIKNLISEDNDFDKVSWIKRKSIIDFKL